MRENRMVYFRMHLQIKPHGETFYGYVLLLVFQQILNSLFVQCSTIDAEQTNFIYLQFLKTTKNKYYLIIIHRNTLKYLFIAHCKTVMFC